MCLSPEECTLAHFALRGIGLCEEATKMTCPLATTIAVRMES